MIMRRASVLLISVLSIAALGFAGPAAAQVRPPVRPQPQPTDRIFISVDGTYQAGTKDFSDSESFASNAETATYSGTYNVKPGPAFTISGSGRVTRVFAVGIGVSRYSRVTPIAVSASIPHPFFFNRPRTLSDTVNGNREELAVHVQARALLPLNSRRMQAAVYAGPSFFSVKQDVLTRVGFAEAYPYDAITSAPGQMSKVSKSKVGFNAGADIAYFFTRQVGVGGTAQYAGTTIQAPSAGGDNVDMKVGGFQVGGGLRLRF
jgi:outer membrane protein with beta-barrel domain